MIDGIIALYIFMLAAFTGYEIIARVPVILHTPLMSGSNFVHGIVLVGAMVALGQAQYAARCALCHGATGREGPAPPLHARTDFANVMRVVAQGQGEMPALSSAMSPGEIEAVAKYVIKTWPPVRRVRRPPPGAEEES
mgnify:CR=1 FL=1